MHTRYVDIVMNFLFVVVIIMYLIYRSVSLFRMIRGFTSCGLLESQYISSCNAANIGHVDEKYIHNGWY